MHMSACMYCSWVIVSVCVSLSLRLCVCVCVFVLFIDCVKIVLLELSAKLLHLMYVLHLGTDHKGKCYL